MILRAEFKCSTRSVSSSWFIIARLQRVHLTSNIKHNRKLINLLNTSTSAPTYIGNRVAAVTTLNSANSHLHYFIRWPDQSNRILANCNFHAYISEGEVFLFDKISGGRYLGPRMLLKYGYCTGSDGDNAQISYNAKDGEITSLRRYTEYASMPNKDRTLTIN